MRVITNPTAVDNEINTIHSLFAEGLQLLHVRKPQFSEIEMAAFLTGIGWEWRSQLVLHSHHHLAGIFGIHRTHFSEKDRVQWDTAPGRFQKPVRCKTPTASTSTHSIAEFNRLDVSLFEAAFLSPIYPSISKPNYASQQNHLETIQQRTNFSTGLIALGGISSENIQQTLDTGFNEVALLGTIWNSTNPIQNFKKCQQIVLSYSL